MIIDNQHHWIVSTSVSWSLMNELDLTERTAVDSPRGIFVADAEVNKKNSEGAVCGNRGY